MKIGIIDADLIGCRKHRFPNLVCEKISGYWKGQNAEVLLLLDYNWNDSFDHIDISKVLLTSMTIAVFSGFAYAAELTPPQKTLNLRAETNKINNEVKD